MTKKIEKKVRRYIKTVLKNIELDGARFLINVLNKIFFFFFLDFDFCFDALYRKFFKKMTGCY